MTLPSTIGNLTAYAGQAVPLTDTITNQQTGLPQNITGWAMEFVVHAPGDPGTVYFRLTTAGGDLTIPVGTDGVVNVLAASLAAKTAVMQQGCYGYSFTRTDAYAVPTTGLLSLLAGPAP